MKSSPLLLVLDTETTGKSPDDGSSVIELAVCLYSTQQRTILQQFSTLLHCRSNPAYEFNLIPAIHTSEMVGVDIFPVFIWLNHLISISSYAIAHNYPFDKAWFDGESLPYLGIPWVDSMDIPFPMRHTEKDSLGTLAQRHGIPIIESHRALPDTVRLCNLLSRVPDLESHLPRLSRPKGVFQALVPAPGRDAKEAGFWWNRDDYPGKWVRNDFIEDVEGGKYPFKTQLLRNI